MKKSLAILLSVCLVMAALAGSFALAEDAAAPFTLTLAANNMKTASTPPTAALGPANFGENTTLQSDDAGKVTVPECSFKFNEAGSVAFVEWNTNPFGTGTAYKAGDEITMTKNMALYAQWMVLTVIANNNTATQNPESKPSDDNLTDFGDVIYVEPDADGNVTLPENTFELNNFNFTGWNAHYDGSGDAYTAGQKVALTAPLAVYAQWQNKNTDIGHTYKVTYHANGGEGVTEDIGGPYTSTLTPVASWCDFTREGYSFVEWNTEPDRSGDAYLPDEDIQPTGEDMVLYAIWQNDETGEIAPPYNATVPSDPGSSIVDPGTSSTEGGTTGTEGNGQGEEPTVEETVTDSDVYDDNPKTGDAASVAGALGLALVAAAALVVTKKRED